MKGGADIITSTLSKALGGTTGGFVAGSKLLVEVLRRMSKSYVYSAAIPPTSAATAIKSLELLQRDPSILSKLRRNTATFRRGMEVLGFDVKGKDHPVCPVMVRDDMAAWKIADHMMRYIGPIDHNCSVGYLNVKERLDCFPGMGSGFPGSLLLLPRQESRRSGLYFCYCYYQPKRAGYCFFCFFFIDPKVRVIVSAQHTEEDIQRALGHFKDAKQFLTNV